MFSPKHPRACALAANPQLLEDITFFPLDKSLYHTSHSDFPIDLTDILHFPQLNFIPPQEYKMSRARRESFQALKKWVFDRNSQVKKIAAGQGIAGTRAAPSQSGSNDSKIGSRLDNGETFTKDGKEYKRYKWQINKNAENATLKDIASKDSHKVWAEADIPITSDNSKAKATVSQLFDDLEESKVPNPNAGRPHYTTASEVATMDFVRNELSTPVPKVLAWSSKADGNPVGSEYIIMEKVGGVQLDKIWPQMDIKKRFELIKTISRYQKAWMSKSFTQYGSLYFSSDLQDHRGCIIVNEDGSQSEYDRFAIGPTTGREFLDDGRIDVDFDRGPWNDLLSYKSAIGFRELACVQNMTQLPRSLLGLYGPGTYQPSRPKKVAAIQDYLSLVQFFLPTDDSICSAFLWHPDLHTENIFVDPDRPSEVLGIIDWQSSEVLPLFDHARQPYLLDYDGPPATGLDPPEFPENFDQLDPPEKAKAERVGRFTCKGCHLVNYCGPECQKAHWPQHKIDCKSSLSKETWQPAYMLERQQPSLPSVMASMKFAGPNKYLWGSTPAVDVLQLESNEGTRYDGDLRLLFAASGDLRNFIQTIARIPGSYDRSLEVTIDDNDSDVVARNIIMLLLLQGTGNGDAVVDCIIHLLVSNVSDQGYLGIHRTLNATVPLLQTPVDNPHATLITFFLNAVNETLTAQDKAKETFELHTNKHLSGYLPSEEQSIITQCNKIGQLITVQAMIKDYSHVFERQVGIQ
ncbi:hypothetical protein CBS147321_5919 [Aspergillus niger]|nr:hypothetical protein CBS133816_8681 [Aspergillus niger]KAI2851201.1 hypothetical protein CBS11350_1105 [Aspergillus niger]KAI2858437.1 hypothetical protein CBS12448_6106 [Aspergillus niger]KAI2914289.1 hypothetical protein CBS147371_6372 [Aspergillus niger]KAI2941212.1 hypothetical protein CBS147321_5919 [Aspergillus niger]